MAARRDHPLRPTPRGVAAMVVDQVRVGERSLATLLPGALDPLTDDDRRLARELIYGVLRHLARLEALASRLLERPLRRRDSLIHALILVGLYQQLETRIPDHAAIAETVAAASPLPWAKRLVNGVLRNFQRRRQALLAEPPGREARYGLPLWLLDRLASDWPQQWPALAEAAMAHPPFTLRVDLARTSREAVLEQLAGLAMEAQPSAITPCSFTLGRGVVPHSLPGFDQGLISVQDEAAQQAARLLAPQVGERLLDACAAPGGKSLHLLEQAAGAVELVAVDQQPERLQRVEENLQRAGRSATLIAADAGDTGQWWDGRPFDRILLDAPCSASGVIRRHPDSKWLRRAEDIPRLAAQQLRLLDRLWPLLKPGGRLLYATCSLLREEGEEPIAHFLATHPDARPLPIVAEWGVTAGAGRQILTGESGMDGFYYALLERHG